MATLADAYVRLRPDTSQVGPELSKNTQGPAEQAGQEAGSHFGRRMALAIGAAVAAGTVVLTRRLLAELKQSIDSASDLNETVSKVGVIFGSGAAAVNRFAEQAAGAMGQSKQEALDGAATFALYGKQAGLSGKALVPFSTNLVKLASDMASFSNTTPQEAIEAIGAAMRGEADPIEKYGVLLNDTVLKQEALRMGLIKTTSQALTPQQRVLAVQSALYKQTAVAQGDFARTSAGLANQQRIAAAQVENLRARIGTALLPVMTAFYGVVNTRLIPILNDLWAKNGPAVTAFLTSMATKFGDLVNRLGQVDFGKVFGSLKDTFANLRRDAGPAMESLTAKIGPFGQAMRQDVLPALGQLRSDAGDKLASTLNVTGQVMQFLADHSDLLAKALPYLAAGFLVVKGAQLAANAASAASPALRVAEIFANRRLAASNVELTAAIRAQSVATKTAATSQAAETATQNVGLLTRVRATAAIVAQRVASIAASAATKVWAAGQWLLNAAMAANPIGLIVIAIAALVAGIIIAYRNSETFRNIVTAAWKAIQAAAAVVVDWFVNTAWPFLQAVWDGIVAGVRGVVTFYVAYFNLLRTIVQAVFSFVADYVRDRISNVIAVVRGIVAVYTFFRDAFERARAAVVEKIVAVVETARGLPGRVTGAIGNLASTLYNTGRDLIEGMIRGIKDKISALVAAVRDTIGAIPGVAKKLLGISSPSRLFREYGRQTIAGYVEGVLADAGRITAAMSAVIPVPPTTTRTSPAAATAGGAIYNVEVKAYTDRFSWRQVQDELALQGVH